MSNEVGREQSEFNMAVSYLNRLNQWFYLAGSASLRLDSFAWFHSLMLLFRELSTEMKDNEIKVWESEISKLNGKIGDNTQYCANTNSTQIPQHLYFRLHKFELFLRKVLKESGLQQKMKEEMDEEPAEW